jgi:hypothetical protein
MRTNRVIIALVSSLLMFFVQFEGFSQSPQGFSYQAVIRDGNGTPISDKVIGLRVTLQDPTQKVLYSETQSPTTSSQGLISVTIGAGTQVSDSAFSSIPWKTGEILVKIEIDPTGGTTYVPMGNPTKLQSVPYALYAENAKEVNSQPNALDDDPIFEVKNKSGQVVFGVYQGGVRVYVADTQIKGSKGGFAVGGLTNQAKAGQAEYFRITPDSARVWVKEVPTVKGAKGGFAVGGLSSVAKTVKTRNLMLIAPDSARIWVNNTAKGSKGGFAVGGLSSLVKTSPTQFLSLTSDNYLIGQEAGRSITTGLYNSFVGFQSGFMNSSGSSNLFLGYQTGYNNITGSNNSFLGYQAGYSNTAGVANTFLGSYTGLTNTSGSSNTFIGFRTGLLNTTGKGNVFIGDSTGYSNTIGQNNVFMGSQSGLSNTQGNYNVFLGYKSGRQNLTGTKNTFVGYKVGFNNSDGLSNVYIGDSTGYYAIGGYNVLIGSQTGVGSNSINNTGNYNAVINLVLAIRVVVIILFLDTSQVDQIRVELVIVLLVIKLVNRMSVDQVTFLWALRVVCQILPVLQMSSLEQAVVKPIHRVHRTSS